MFIYFPSFSIQLLTMGTIDRKYNNVGTSLSSFFAKRKTLIWEKAIRKSSTLLLLTFLFCVIDKDKTMEYLFVRKTFKIRTRQMQNALNRNTSISML